MKVRNKLITRGSNDKIATVGDLSINELRALLSTMASDDNLIIHKLEIREKQNNCWRVVARVSRAKDAAKIIK